MKMAAAFRITSLLLGQLLITPHSFADTGSWQYRELKRFKASEANQGVAVDKNYFYAIGNREIGQYRKTDGIKVSEWKSEPGGKFIHINQGVVKDGELYGAHSNFPSRPMVSSVEIWDTKTLQPVDSHSFGKTDGSLTSISFHDGFAYTVFAHYTKKGGAPGRGPEFTRFVKYDNQWQAVGEWKFPTEVVKRFAGYSSSCAVFGPENYLYATGHDAKELYVLEVPQGTGTLKLIATIPVTFEGQAFAWDPVKPNVIYGIARKTREVVIAEITMEK